MGNGVKYRKLVNLGNYENEAIELESDVLDGETRAEVYERLRAEAHELMGRNDVLRDMKGQISRLIGQRQEAESSLYQVVRNWKNAVTQYNQLRQLLDQHGVKVDGLPHYMIPEEMRPTPAPVDNGDEDEDEGTDRAPAF